MEICLGCPVGYLSHAAPPACLNEDKSHGPNHSIILDYNIFPKNNSTDVRNSCDVACGILDAELLQSPDIVQFLP